MRIAVLCGGKGTRLGYSPKCLIPTCGRPFIEYKIEQLITQRFTDITLLVGPFVRDFMYLAGKYPQVTALVRDDQTGVENALHQYEKVTGLPLEWWCNGDTLLYLIAPIPKTVPDRSIGLATTHLIEPPNVNGEFLDAGLYYGWPPFEWRICESKPRTINTPAQHADTEKYLLHIEKSQR